MGFGARRVSLDTQTHSGSWLLSNSFVVRGLPGVPVGFKLQALKFGFERACLGSEQAHEASRGPKLETKLFKSSVFEQFEGFQPGLRTPWALMPQSA